MKSIYDRLLESSTKDFEPEVTDYSSRALKRALGSDEDVIIKVKGLKYKAANSFMKEQLDKDGKYDFDKGGRAKARMVAQCIVEPNLGDEKLLNHFGCTTPADLAELLFGLEITEISDLIMELSGIVKDEDEIASAIDEAKN